MKAVIAGSYREYENWRREGSNYLLESFYVDDSGHNLRGREDIDEVVLCGTYYNRPRFSMLRDLAEYAALCQHAKPPTS